MAGRSGNAVRGARITCTGRAGLYVRNHCPVPKIAVQAILSGRDPGAEGSG